MGPKTKHKCNCTIVILIKIITDVQMNMTRTQFDVKDACGRDDLHRVGGDTLVITSVCRVQVLNSELGSGLCFAYSYSSLFLDHGGIVLEPANGRSWVAGHFAVQRGRLTLEVSDVVDGLLELQEITLGEIKHSG